mmetsp:Transcript_17019/g.55677  ORF Transcript_17019/g.55677 Transcript_17019/m.55677 type:complete len:328 (-) Transcript_17019:679-1662(-)
MDVVLDARPEVEHDHRLDIRDVEAARSHVRGAEHRCFSRLELSKRLLTLPLVLVAVNGARRFEAGAVEVSVELFAAALRARKDDGALALRQLRLENLYEPLLLLIFAHKLNRLLHVRIARQLVAVDVADADHDSRGGGVALSDALHLLRPRRAEHQRLSPRLRRHIHDRLDGGLKAHIEHAVRLIQNHVRRVAHGDERVPPVLRLEKIFEASRRGHDAVCPFAHSVNLLRLRGTPVQHHNLGIGRSAELDRLGANLLCELPRRGDDEHARGNRLRPPKALRRALAARRLRASLLRDANECWEHESRRLAAPRLCNGDQIFPSDSHRP